MSQLLPQDNQGSGPMSGSRNQIPTYRSMNLPDRGEMSQTRVAGGQTGDSRTLPTEHLYPGLAPPHPSVCYPWFDLFNCLFFSATAMCGINNGHPSSLNLIPEAPDLSGSSRDMGKGRALINDK
uniref:Uncharacterized protein n=1 Tax=Bionectria ochroleuca TaxID=29856 RepID=A0A8H7NNE2_BIOOC